MKKKVAILGSTGSIGKTLINVLKKNKKDFQIVLLTSNNNLKIIIKQAKLFHVKNLIITNHEKFLIAKKKLKHLNINVFNNFNSIETIFKKQNVDYTMNAISSFYGLEPTLKMIKYSKTIAIANKESIICGWPLIQKKLKKHKCQFIPIDSEHFSIRELINKPYNHNIEKVFITASGGPFINYPLKKFKSITRKEALKHPNWSMGKKISIDSATLMNKMFELIEAQKLFSIPKNKLDVVIHPESLVHAIIELENGLYKFIYHETSMIIPLANAIFESKLNIKEFLNFKSTSDKNNIYKSLNFKKVNNKIFPIINLKNRINEHNSTPIIINAINEILVDQYLKQKLPFASFYKLILSVLNDRNYKKYAIKEPKDIEQILQIDKWSRRTTYEKIERKKNA